MPKQTVLQPEQQPSKIVLSSQMIYAEVKAFFGWWYVEMPTWYMGFFQRLVVLCDDTFSISLLLKTFWVPWHRDSSLIGRLFGICIRLLYLPLAMFISALIIVLLLIIAILWALMPLTSLFFLLRTPFT